MYQGILQHATGVHVIYDDADNIYLISETLYYWLVLDLMSIFVEN